MAVFRWTNNTGNFQLRWTRAETKKLADGGYSSAANFGAWCGAVTAFNPYLSAGMVVSCTGAYAQYVRGAKQAMRTSYTCIMVRGDISPFCAIGPSPYTCVKA